jgi:hypothetical protein
LPRREHVVGRELRRAVAQVAVVVDDQRSAEGVTQISSGRSSVAVHRWLIEPRSNVASHDGIAELCRIAEGFTGTAQQFCERVLVELAPEGARDDICVVAAKLIAQPR